MRALAFAAVLVLTLLSSSEALAQREHRVRQGQSLARIARRYHVEVSDLAGANRLAPNAALRPGMVLIIPSDGEIFVTQGQTLQSIARARSISVEDLARANRLRIGARLRIGQRLVVPGYEAPRGGGDSPVRRWGRARTPGVATFFREGDERNRRTRVRLVDRTGRVRRQALADVARVMQPRHERLAFDVHPRLVRLLARISDYFGGRPIHIVSGFRAPGGYTNESSRHTRGHALDFRIPGVPNTAIRDLCRTFDDVGVGYYPNSSFVHLDVRDQNQYWIDYAGPGEAPRYQGRGQPAAPAEQPQGENDADGDDGAPPTDDQPGQISDE